MISDELRRHYEDMIGFFVFVDHKSNSDSVYTVFGVLRDIVDDQLIIKNKGTSIVNIEDIISIRSEVNKNE